MDASLFKRKNNRVNLEGSDMMGEPLLPIWKNGCLFVQKKEQSSQYGRVRYDGWLNFLQKLAYFYPKRSNFMGTFRPQIKN
jgi:hypothetical protein